MTIDVIRNIYPDGEYAACLTIRPWAEAPDTIELCTNNKESIDYFGTISIVMNRQMAIDIGKALIDAAREM